MPTCSMVFSLGVSGVAWIRQDTCWRSFRMILTSAILFVYDVFHVDDVRVYCLVLPPEELVLVLLANGLHTGGHEELVSGGLGS